jgi:NAD(P)-dependent dehydrogenase (short-subunit alcohol dehydrogenase family)
LVNVAGGATGAHHKRGPLLEVTEQDFMTTFDVNVKSVYLCSKEVVPLMQAQGKGVIINMASGTGHENGRPLMGMGAYAASKAAIINLTKTMAHEWGPHVRVNCICPGLIDTPRTSAARTQEEKDARVARIDLKRIGVPEDVGRLALYLASDAANYISGSAFDVDGGG